MSWLSEGTSKFNKLKMKYYTKNYRGVHAARKIKVLNDLLSLSYNNHLLKAKDEILYIPNSHLISLEMAKQTSVGMKIIENQVDLLSPKHSFLSTFLLQERKDLTSFWKPYLDILPSDFDTVPIFFSEEDLAWLEGSPFLEQVKEKKFDIKKDYDAICRVFNQANID